MFQETRQSKRDTDEIIPRNFMQYLIINNKSQNIGNIITTEHW